MRVKRSCDRSHRGAELLMDEPSNADRDGGAVAPERASTRAWYLLLLLPMIGTLIPPIYNTRDPTLIGIPFFYWYLMAWVPVTVVCLMLISRFTREDRR
jgi:hypothetical protein